MKINFVDLIFFLVQCKQILFSEHADFCKFRSVELQIFFDLIITEYFKSITKF